MATVRQALGKTPGASADGLETVHSVLCRREAQSFQRAAVQTGREGDELLVACTQEQRLFLELNEQTEGAAPVQERPIRFVNIRETGGWSRDAAQAAPKLAAIIAAGAAVALFRFKVGVLPLIAACGAIGLVTRLAGLGG